MKLKVVSRELLRDTLAVHRMTLSDQTPVEVLQKIRVALAVDAVVLGKVERTDKQLILSVSVKRVSDGQGISFANASADRSDFFGSLTSYPSIEPPHEIRKVGEGGISSPECLDCPVPQFRSKADASSQALLVLAISSQGRVAAVKVLKGAGPEFADEAFQALRVFRYKPAHDRDERPVPVAIFFEVFFLNK